MREYRVRKPLAWPIARSVGESQQMDVQMV